MRVLAILSYLLIAPVVIVFAGSQGPIDIGEKLVYGFQHGNDLWLATEREGIFVVDMASGQVDHLVEDGGIPTNKTTCGASHLGKIWLGSQNGLYVWDSGQVGWDVIGSEYLPSSSVTCLASQGDILWVGTNRGVARFDSRTGSWITYTRTDGLSDDWVLSIGTWNDSVWFGTMRGGVSQLDLAGDAWSSWKREDGLVSNTVFSICASPDHVFAGTTSGLCVLDRSTGMWTGYGTEVLPSSAVYSIFWDSQGGRSWIGTGYGISLYDPVGLSFESITKVGEIDLERINDFIEVGDVIWFLRPTNRWYAHMTTGIIGFDRRTSSWVRPIYFDVLIDQSGYGPGDVKRFIVQSNEPVEGIANFSIFRGAGKDVYSAQLGPRFDRDDWDAYYWVGDFSDLQRRGNFTISVTIGNHSASSPRFEIDNEVLLDECGELIYEFLRYMRCGISHEYRPEPCHLDDGVLPNGTHIDATGGWHCAGIWGGKWTSYHTYVLFNLLLAQEMRPDFFDPIDRDANGLSDILDEAMWGCDYLLRLQLENGTILQEVEKVEETDNMIGTHDDRKIFGWMSTYNGLLAVAGLAGTSSLIGESFPTEATRYLQGAYLSFDHYGSLVAGGPGNSIEAAAMTLACIQLHRATGNGTYLDMAEGYCKDALELPFASYRGSFVPVALGYYAVMNPSTAWKDRIIEYIVDMADQQVAKGRAKDNPHLPFEIPQWELYLMDPWAAEVLFAYRFTGNRSYLDYAIGLVDCHLGVNPYGICFMEGTGTINPPAYTSSFVSPSNPRGAVPGSIPQGIQFRRERPYYDMSMSPEYSSGETWLINTNFLQTISLLPKDTQIYPLEIVEYPIILIPMMCWLVLLSRKGMGITRSS